MEWSLEKGFLAALYHKVLDHFSLQHVISPVVFLPPASLEVWLELLIALPSLGISTSLGYCLLCWSQKMEIGSDFQGS